jgi:hypothetical protein
VTFIAFLQSLLNDVQGPVFVIVGGHSCHRSKKTKEFVAANARRLSLFVLPPYPPEMNPDQRLWTNAKRDNVGRTAAQTVDGLKNGLNRATEDSMPSRPLSEASSAIPTSHTSQRSNPNTYEPTSWFRIGTNQVSGSRWSRPSARCRLPITDQVLQSITLPLRCGGVAVDARHDVLRWHSLRYHRSRSDVTARSDPNSTYYSCPVADHRVRFNYRRVFIDFPPAFMRRGILVDKFSHYSRTITNDSAVANKPSNSGIGTDCDSVAYVCAVGDARSLADRAAVADAHPIFDHAASSDSNPFMDCDLIADKAVQSNSNWIADQRRPWILLRGQQPPFFRVAENAVLAHDAVIAAIKQDRTRSPG